MAQNFPEKIATQNKIYKIKEVLGEGGTSIVYLANDGKRDVALKILGEEVDANFRDRYVQIMKNEFEVLSRLRHPNIAEVYDFEYSPDLGKYFFTTEYIKGTDIYSFTQSSDFHTKEELFVQLLAALEYTHRCGVIHCDIKCGNALVTQVKSTPVLKLVDFGFATRKLASGGNVVGTAHYMAPELLTTERKDVDHRIDIYAAGVVYYRLLHRSYPYDATSVNAILKWHREKTPIPFNESLPEYIRQLIGRMLATIPTDRVGSCAKAIEFINFRTEGRYKKYVSKIAGLQFREGPIVARSAVFEKITEQIAALKDKKSPVCTGFAFVGVQGIGKSRLVREIKYRAELEEIPLREFSCVEGQNHVDEFIASFAGLGLPVRDDGGKSEDKRKIFDITWVNALLEKFSSSGLFLVIDDVQLADSSFVKFLLLIEERLKVKRSEGELPVVLLAGVRPKPELGEVVARWFDVTKLDKIELSLFSKDDVAYYMSSIGIDEPQKHVNAALEFSGGVPGLVEAYCQYLLSPGRSAGAPASVAQSYIERAKRLSKKSFAMLELASVARRNLRLDDACELLKFEKDEGLKFVQELVSSGFADLVYPSMDVKITNKAIAQVIKSGLDAQRLRELSGLLGLWFEKHDKSSLAELAEYFNESGRSDYAECYAESAAKSFEEKFNNSDAAKYYELALKHSNDPAKKRGLIRAVSRMNILMGVYRSAIERLEKLIAEGDRALENYRLLGMAYSKMRDFVRAQKWYEDGLRIMNDDTAITDIVQFKNSLGNVYFYTGDLEKSEKYFTEAIADATVCLLLNNNLGMILGAKGNYEQAIRFYDNRKRYLAAKQNKRALSLCYAECGYIHMTNNNPAAAIAELEESYRLAKEIGDLYNMLVIVGNLVRCYQLTAQYSKALETALAGLEIEGSVGSVEEIAQNHLTIGILYETIGITDLAKNHIQMALDRFAALGSKLMLGWCHLSLSFLYKDLDKFDEAMKELSFVEEITQQIKTGDLELWSKLAKSELLIEYGKIEEVGHILSKVQPSQTKELEIRKRLLDLRAGLVAQNEIAPTFEGIIEEAGDLPELKWEILSSFGEWLEKNGREDDAMKAFKSAFEIIETTANNLSIAYRDSYMSQRFRLRVVKRFIPDFSLRSSGRSDSDESSVGHPFDEKTSEIK